VLTLWLFQAEAAALEKEEEVRVKEQVARKQRGKGLAKEGTKVQPKGEKKVPICCFSTIGAQFTFETVLCHRVSGNGSGIAPLVKTSGTNYG
jgi:hypothetical protein